MFLKVFFAVTFLATCLFPPIYVDADLTETVPLLTKGEDSCNVVQVNCGSAGHDHQHKGHQGPPGPSGQKGEHGPVGPKGEKGHAGERGEKGDDFDKLMVLNTITVTSCRELNEIYGVSTTGYYPLRINGTGDLVSRYCDFRIYEGVSNCEEFISWYSISKTGFYRFRDNVAADPTYHYCPDVFTCEQMKERDNIETSGIYMLGPQDNQYKVYCDFSQWRAITTIRHNTMDEVLMTSCEAAGCYSKIPQYEIDVDNIVKIMENSRDCRQYIKVRCKHLHLTAFSWWISRGGEKMTYWGGAISRRVKYCACGETGSCADAERKCNCDKNDLVVRQDEGFLTDKTKLPVKELRFGDLGDAVEAGWHTLGPLECMG